jgi:integrative and conjugative element protein (TIGR02256 family)
MTFVRKTGGRVHLAGPAVEKLLVHRQLQDSSPEAGGVMLGRLILGTSDVIVDAVTGPFTEDKYSRVTFFRSRRRAQQVVDETWHTSRGTKIYLGEWHTHPEDIPSPSSQDLRNWRKICEAAVYEQKLLLFLIAGRVSFRIWELSRGVSPEEIICVDSIGLVLEF